MKMYSVKVINFALKRASQRRCPIESPEQGTSKISNAHAVQNHRNFNWHLAISRAIDIRSKNFNFMSPRYQRLAKPMHRNNRSAISHGGQVGGNDV